MTKNSIFKNKRFLIIGMGKTGLACANYLLEAKASNVTTFDDNDKGDGKNQEILKQSIKQKLAKKMFDYVILSPGVPHPLPHKHELVEIAITNHINVITDLDLLYMERPDDTYIAITGSNGKSTVTSLIGHVLSAAYKNGLIQQKPIMAGNIGTPVMGLELSDQHNKKYIFVIEVSSFQSERIKYFSPDYSAFINLQKDHLDRHGDMDGYFKAKKVLLDKSKKNIICIDDEYGKKLSSFYENKIIVNSHDDKFKEFIDYAENLYGKHNQQNIAIAVTIAKAMNIDDETIKSAIKNFEPLEHRQEKVKEIEIEIDIDIEIEMNMDSSSNHKKVVFINDSKATNFDSTIPALEAFKNIVWIAGGRLKDGSLDDKITIDRINNNQNILQAFFIGEAKDKLAESFTNIKSTTINTLDSVIEEIKKDLIKNKDSKHYNDSDDLYIVFSPACASYDQYKNFEERGAHFKSLVNNIKNQ